MAVCVSRPWFLRVCTGSGMDHCIYDASYFENSESSQFMFNVNFGWKDSQY